MTRCRSPRVTIQQLRRTLENIVDAAETAQLSVETVWFLRLALKNFLEHVRATLTTKHSLWNPLASTDGRQNSKKCSEKSQKSAPEGQFWLPRHLSGLKQCKMACRQTENVRRGQMNSWRDLFTIFQKSGHVRISSITCGWRQRCGFLRHAVEHGRVTGSTTVAYTTLRMPT